MPTSEMRGLMPQARVHPLTGGGEIVAGDALLGRVLDAEGTPIDGRGRLKADAHTRLDATPINPLARAPVATPLDVGVRAINALLTVGRGQRLGLFAGTGVGQSALQVGRAHVCTPFTNEHL